MTDAFGVDIGGSGVKGAPVSIARGHLTSDRIRIDTPEGEHAVIETVATIVAEFGWRGPVGVAIPGVVRNGVLRSAVNLVGDWEDTDVRTLLSRRLGVAVSVLNDADAAGLAESRYGAGHDVPGVVLVLTFGTGIGSAIIHDGVLLPNTEFGHLMIHDMELEHYAAARLVDEGTLTFDDWADRAAEVIEHLDFILSPDLIVVGGGISKEFADLAGHLSVDTPVVPAQLRNDAGIVGAALTSSIRRTT